jgi:hypothetical protein
VNTFGRVQPPQSCPALELADLHLDRMMIQPAARPFVPGAAGQQIGGVGRLIAKARKRHLGDPQPSGMTAGRGFETVGVWCRPRCRALDPEVSASVSRATATVSPSAIAVLASAWRRVRSSTSSLAPISQRSQPLELGPGVSLELAGLAQHGARAGSGAACNLGRVFPLALLDGAD